MHRSETPDLASDQHLSNRSEPMINAVMWRPKSKTNNKSHNEIVNVDKLETFW